MENINVQEEEIKEVVVETADEIVDLKKISKEEFQEKTKELYEKMAGLTKRTDINDDEKKTLAQKYTEDIKALLKPFFSLGISEVSKLRKKETENMEQLVSLYSVILKYNSRKTSTGPVALSEVNELESEIRLLNEAESNNTKIKFFKDIEKVIADAGNPELKDYAAFMSNQKRDLEAKLISYSTAVFDVELILNTITPATLKEKTKTLTDTSLFNFKKLKFAKFVKTKMANPEFLKQFKKDMDFIYIVASLYRTAAHRVITIDDISEHYLVAGETKEDYLKKFLAPNSKELSNLSMLCAIFTVDFVMSMFNSNTISKSQRHMFLGLLYNRGNYDFMREIIIKYVYTIGDMTY